MSARILGPITRIVTVNSTSPIFIPLTDFFPAATMAGVQALIEVGAGWALFRGTPAFQTATTVTTSPNTAETLEGAPTWVAPDARDATTTTTPDTTGDFYARLGVFCKLDSGSSAAGAEVTVTFVIQS